MHIFSYFSENNWAAPSCSMALSTFAGAITKGPIGAATGFASTLADEVLKNNGIDTQHGCTRTCFWSTLAAYPLLNMLNETFKLDVSSPVLGTASLAYGVAMSYFSPDFLNIQEKFSIPIESFLQLNHLFVEKETAISDQKELSSSSLVNTAENYFEYFKKNYANPFTKEVLKAISLMGASSALEIGYLWYMGYYVQNNFLPFFLVDHADLVYAAKEGIFSSTASFAPFYEIASKFLGLILISTCKIILSKIINAYQGLTFMSVFDLCMKKNTELMMKDQNGRKLLLSEKGRKLPHQLPQDLSSLLFSGGLNQFYTQFDEITNALMSLYILNRLAPSSLLTSSLVLSFLNPIFQHLGKKIKNITATHKDVTSDLWGKKYEVITHIKQIYLRDAQPFFKHKIEELHQTESNLKTKRSQLEILQNALSQLSTNVVELSNAFLLLLLNMSEKLSIANIPLIWSSLTKLNTLLKSPLEHQSKNKDALLALENVKSFLDIIESDTLSTLVRTTNTEDKILIKNYLLNMKNEPLIQIDEFAFEKGKHYALMGQSGSGKSTLLKDLHIGLFRNVDSHGEVSIYEVNGEKASTLFLDQDLFLPSNCTLFECICFPKLASSYSQEQQNRIKKQVLQLFDELSIDGYAASEENCLANQIDSKDFSFSGGQQKKIGMIQAILEKPDILFMDETFTGLDSESLVKCQTAIKKYLPHTTIISIDHYANEENHSSFYDTHLSIQDKKLQILNSTTILM